HKCGSGLFSRGRKKQVDELLAAVGATDYAHAPAGTISGGELQRLRVAQSLAYDPSVLLCDESLVSLAINRQQVISALLHEQRFKRDAGVVIVTHEINPTLLYVDRILYVVGGHFLVGTPS